MSDPILGQILIGLVSGAIPAIAIISGMRVHVKVLADRFEVMEKHSEKAESALHDRITAERDRHEDRFHVVKE